MMVTSIEAHGMRAVGTGDIKGACLCAEQNDFTTVKLINEQADVMISINPQGKNCAIIEGKNKCMCIILPKALHGIARVAILWFALLTKTLVDLSFKCNPCDFCVVNETIKGKQCTIVYHVDDDK